MNTRQRLANAYAAEPDEEADGVDQRKEPTHGDQVWGQQPGEPSRWFARFTKYCQQGPNRSIFAVYIEEPIRPGSKRSKREDNRPLGGVPGAWRKQADRWQWEARAREFDTYYQDKAQVEWEQNRQAIRAAEWEAFGLLTFKAKKMLEFALATKTSENQTGADGKTTITTILKPARWSMGDAARLMKTASEIGRLATGMETSRELVTVAERTPEELSDDELYSIAASGATSSAPIVETSATPTDPSASGADPAGTA